MIDIQANFLRLLCTCGLLFPLSVPAGGPGNGEASPDVRDHYVNLDDIRMYYRSAGEGAPVILLHGGFGSSDTWKAYFHRLPGFRLIAPDSRGQGRSTIGEGPVTYGRMAGDVIRLMDHLQIDTAHLVGFSDGGCIALHLLVDYADRVSSATLIGTPFHTDNYPREVYAGLEDFISRLADPSDPALVARREAYTRLAPDPGAWSTLVEKLGQTWLSRPSFNDRELEFIDSPVLVIKVDEDQYLPARIFEETARLIPDSRLHYLPGGGHAVHEEMPAELAPSLHRFLRETTEKN